ncbi:MAG: glycosyltransferase, partial [bacterium]|nr:glycosyltransferase [bacterium]
NKILKKADKILATSAEYVNGSIWLSKYSEKVNIVPLGIDIKFFMNKAEDKSIEDIKNTHGNDLVLFIGRLVYYKGLEYLIKAMKGVDAKLLVIGEGPLKEHLTGLSIKEEVADRIVFLGNTSEEEKINYLSSASVFCLPSVERSEAYGIVQLEAMACGVPVINTRIQGSGIHTLSLHNETGLTVQPADPQALTNAVNTLLNDKKLAKKMGENGKLRVEKYYTKELMAKNILEIYKELLS